MRIVVIEDEPRIASRIQRMLTSIFQKKLESIKVFYEVESGTNFIQNNEIDLLCLDLNLNGEDGFEVLKLMVADSFHTIIISAYKEKAITAFEYGVIDFIPKPFTEERLLQACERITTQQKVKPGAKFLAINKNNQKHLITVDDVIYIQGAGVYSEIHTRDGKKHLHNKTLEKLLILLPDHFIRIHKSYIANMSIAEGVKSEPGSRYYLLVNEEELPIGRTKYKAIKKHYF